MEDLYSVAQKSINVKRSVTDTNNVNDNVKISNKTNVKRYNVTSNKEAQSIALSLDDIDNAFFYEVAIGKFGLREVRSMMMLAKDKGVTPKRYFSGIYRNKLLEPLESLEV